MMTKKIIEDNELSLFGASMSTSVTATELRDVERVVGVGSHAAVSRSSKAVAPGSGRGGIARPG